MLIQAALSALRNAMNSGDIERAELLTKELLRLIALQKRAVFVSFIDKKEDKEIFIPIDIPKEETIKMPQKVINSVSISSTPLVLKSIEYDLTSDKWQSNSDGTVEYNNSIWVNKPIVSAIDLVFDVYADVAGDVPLDSADLYNIHNVGKPVYTIVIAEGDIRSELGNIISLGGLSKDLSCMYSDAIYTGSMPNVVIAWWGSIILAQEEVV